MSIIKCLYFCSLFILSTSIWFCFFVCFQINLNSKFESHSVFRVHLWVFVCMCMRECVLIPNYQRKNRHKNKRNRFLNFPTWIEVGELPCAWDAPCWVSQVNRLCVAHNNNCCIMEKKCNIYRRRWCNTIVTWNVLDVIQVISGMRIFFNFIWMKLNKKSLNWAWVNIATELTNLISKMS